MGRPVQPTAAKVLSTALPMVLVLVTLSGAFDVAGQAMAAVLAAAIDWLS